LASIIGLIKHLECVDEISNCNFQVEVNGELLIFENVVKSENTVQFRLEGVQYNVKLEDNCLEVYSVKDKLKVEKGGREAIGGKGRLIRARVAGRIVKIHVKVGCKVKKDDPLLTMEAMKLMVEVKSPINGIVREILVGEEENVKVGSPLMIIGGEG